MSNYVHEGTVFKSVAGLTLAAFSLPGTPGIVLQLQSIRGSAKRLEHHRYRTGTYAISRQRSKLATSPALWCVLESEWLTMRVAMQRAKDAGAQAYVDAAQLALNSLLQREPLSLHDLS